MKKSGSELPLVDTNTYRRNAGDLLRGVALAFGAAALYCVGVALKLSALTGLAGTVLFGAALVCSFRARLLAPVLFIAVIAVMPAEYPSVIRLSLFSLVLAALSRTSRAIFLAPIIMALWFLSLLLNGILQALFDLDLFRDQGGVLAPLTVELLGALLLQLALFSPTLTKIFVLPPRSITLRQFVFLFVQLGALFSAVITGGVLTLLEPSLARSLERNLSSAPFITGYLLLFFLPALAAFSGGSFLSRALRLVAEGSVGVPSSRFFLQGPVVAEFHRLQRGLLDQFQALVKERDELSERREDQSTAHPVSPALDTRERECFVTLCDSAPFGCFAISNSGFILASSKSCGELLELGDEKLGGRSLSSLTKKSSVVAELSQHVTRFFQTTGKKNPVRFFTPSPSGHLLDLSLLEAPYSEDETALGHSTPSQQILLVYIRRSRDFRSLALSFFSPSLLEIEGLNAQELLRELRDDLLLLERKVSAAKKILALGGAKQMDIPALLSELEHFSTVTKSDIDTTVRGYQNPVQSTLDLGLLLKSGAALLGETAGFFAPEVRCEYSTPSPSTPQTSSNLNHLLNPLSITGEPREVHRFTALLFGVIQSGGVKGAHFSCSVDQEEILPETAKLIPGSNPGKYVRVTVTCENLRVGTSVLSDDFRSILPTDSTQLEVSMIALSAQARRLGGFLSLQYRGAKDSVLTVYVPQLKGKSEPPARKRKSRFLNDAIASSLPCGVAICSEADLVYDFESPLVKLGFAPQIERKSALGGGDELVDFAGSGFGDAGERTRDILSVFPAAEIRSVLETNHARLLVLSVTEESEQVVSFLERLELTHPELGIVLIVDEEQEHHFERWVRVIRPFDSEVLVQALEVACSADYSEPLEESEPV